MTAGESFFVEDFVAGFTVRMISAAARDTQVVPRRDAAAPEVVRNVAGVRAHSPAPPERTNTTTFYVAQYSASRHREQFISACGINDVRNAELTVRPRRAINTRFRVCS